MFRDPVAASFTSRSPMMPRLIYALIACLSTGATLADDIQVPDETIAAASANNSAPDSKQMEKDLQNLPWKQFRSVIESIQKLKADVEAYGPIGWQYVQSNYTTHGWKKNIDRLDDAQKKGLAELIRIAKGTR